MAERVEGPCDIVFEKDAENALRLMKTEKAPGCSGITADLLKFHGRKLCQKTNRCSKRIVRGPENVRELEKE